MTGKDANPTEQIIRDRAAAAKEERESREAKALRANLMRRKQQQRARPQDEAPSSAPDER
ncbi:MULTISPECIES: hypothetical protein [Gluconobacter]|uniref:Amidase n=1 Tax=Gluconobacter kondonii TaxID=941463 RepID=A0ABQ5WTJ9_9PROT|nr:MULTISPECIES: hypothetical protein [Gluconobacter]MBN3866824.1 hypothetical protein [Gluconobacter kondonii]MBS1052677.1 hypothetical protein [Gluconobacter kondonii]MBS1056070.1 hypothetical protein [Gluconobacter kondonii]MBS1065177.1 hypothetical protein [Gluconobacter kondonii]MBS1077157.1 hypothetical protein [Gluconobacter kondonii]